MAILIDLIVIGILLVSTYIGYKKGLIGVAFKILSFIIAVIITLILFKPISNYIINHTNIAQTLENTITEKLANVKIENGEISKDETNLPNVVINYINKGIDNTINQTKDNIIKTVAENLSHTIIELVVIIGLFIITRLLLIFAKTMLEAVAQIPLVKQFNEVGGIAYGILKGILIIYVILAIISVVVPMLENKTILEVINSSILTKILYNNNLILMLFL